MITVERVENSGMRFDAARSPTGAALGLIHFYLFSPSCFYELSGKDYANVTQRA